MAMQSMRTWHERSPWKTCQYFQISADDSIRIWDGFAKIYLTDACTPTVVSCSSSYFDVLGISRCRFGATVHENPYHLKRSSICFTNAIN